jgi:hypothetical protein
MKLRPILESLLPLFFVTLWPMGNFININAGPGVPWLSMIVAFLVVFAGSALTAWLISKFFWQNNFSRAAVFVSLLLAILFSHRPSNSFMFGTLELSAPLRNGIWLVAALSLIGFAWRSQRLAALRWPLAFISGAMAISSVTTGLVAVAKTAQLREAHAKQHPLGTAKPNLPNIYWIVLDSYTSNAAFRDFLDYDNSAFESFLKNHGFFIASEAQSNYNWTHLSMSSTLKMDYLVDPSGKNPQKTESGEPAPSEIDLILAGEGGFPVWARANGYRIAQIDGAIRCSAAADMCLSDLQNYLSSPFSIYLWHTPILSFLWRISPRLATMPLGVDAVTNQLPISNTAGPAFIFGHAWALHSPPTRLSDCSPRLWSTNMQAQYQWDGHKVNPGRPETITQLECVNRAAQELVSKLVSADPSALIIINGDHGLRPGISPNLVDPANALQMRAHFEILNALRLPADCAAQLHSRLSPVNSFRLVRNCVHKNPADALPLLPDNQVLQKQRPQVD